MNIKLIIYFLARLLTGLLFVYSAYSKTLSADDFEIRLIQTGLISWQLAPLLAFLIIAGEFFIGFYLMTVHLFSKVLHRITWGFLILFTIYLTYLLAKYGNDINCGCMGNEIPFTPLEAIIKNIITMGLLFLIGKWASGFPVKAQYQSWLLTGYAALSIGFSFYLLPLDLQIGGAYEEDISEPFDYKTILDSGKVHTANFDFNKEKYYAFFLSMTCSHCRITADKLAEIHEKDKDIPMLIVLNGDSTLLDAYLKEHKIADIPHTMLYGDNFSNLAGTRLPAIYMVRNNVIRKKLKHRWLDLRKMEMWLK